MEIFFSRKVALCSHTANDRIWEWVTRGQLEVSAIVHAMKEILSSVASHESRFYNPSEFLPLCCWASHFSYFFHNMFLSMQLHTCIHMWWFFPSMPDVKVINFPGDSIINNLAVEGWSKSINFHLRDARRAKMKWRTNNKTSSRGVSFYPI